MMVTAQTSHTVTTSAEYEFALKTLLCQPGPHYVLYSASFGADDMPWCPDCTRSLSTVKAAITSAAGSLLEVRLERPEWKDKAKPHAFRRDPLNLAGIPTLLAVKPDGSEAGRIGEELESASTPEEVAVLVTNFIKQTAH